MEIHPVHNVQQQTQRRLSLHAGVYIAGMMIRIRTVLADAAIPARVTWMAKKVSPDRGATGLFAFGRNGFVFLSDEAFPTRHVIDEGRP